MATPSYFLKDEDVLYERVEKGVPVQQVVCRVLENLSDPTKPSAHYRLKVVRVDCDTKPAEFHEGQIFEFSAANNNSETDDGAWLRDA